MKLDWSRIDPELRPGLEFAPPGLDTLDRSTVVQVRAARAEGANASPPAGLSITEHAITTPAGPVRALLYQPIGAHSNAAVLWIHGGGYVLGTAEDDRAGLIANALSCSVLSVDYRLAQKAPFPAGVEDCYHSLLWLVAQGSELGIDPQRVAIAGQSGGGGMAAGLALLNRDRQGPAVRLQLLLYPMIDNLHDTRSGQYSNHPVWNRETSLRAWEMYLNGTPGRDASPYAAASRASDLAGLPPTYICVGSEDLFRDENIEYGRRLLEAGVPTELAVFPGLYHGGDLFVPQAKTSQRLEQSFLASLRHALEL